MYSSYNSYSIYLRVAVALKALKPKPNKLDLKLGPKVKGEPLCVLCVLFASAYIIMRFYMYIYVYICIYMYTRIIENMCMCMCMYMYMYMHMCMCMCMCMRMCIYIYIFCVHMHIYTHMLTCHMCKHICAVWGFSFFGL